MSDEKAVDLARSVAAAVLGFLLTATLVGLSFHPQLVNERLWLRLVAALVGLFTVGAGIVAFRLVREHRLGLLHKRRLREIEDLTFVDLGELESADEVDFNEDQPTFVEDAFDL